MANELSEFLARLRSMTDTGADDYTVNSTSYWTDTQLTSRLEQYRSHINHEALAMEPNYISGGSIEYKRYLSRYRNFSGETDFIVQDADGGTISSDNYSLDPVNGVVTFNSDTGGSTYYATGYIYNLNRAAATVWREKAAHYARRIDFKTDNHSISTSQLIDNALKMAKRYESAEGVKSIRMVRNDVA